MGVEIDGHRAAHLDVTGQGREGQGEEQGYGKEGAFHEFTLLPRPFHGKVIGGNSFGRAQRVHGLFLVP